MNATTKPAPIKVVSNATTPEAAHLANYTVFIDAAKAYDSAKVTSFMGVSMAAGIDAATKGTEDALFDTTKPVAEITRTGSTSQPFKVKTFGGVPSGNRYKKYATLAEAEAALKAWAKRRFRVLNQKPAAPVAEPVAATVTALAADMQDEPAATKPLALSVILHAANSAAFAVPTSLYYEAGQVSMKQVCIELSCVDAEPLITGNGWTAYVQANAADYAGNKRNHLAEQELAKLTDFDFTEVGGIYGPVLLLKDAD